jgi:RES domain-containing protein
MEVFRLARERHANELSGKGAALKGARWNSAGIEVIYTAANRSLAMAEVAVHLTLATIPDDFVMLTIQIPDDVSFLKLSPSDLPLNWNAFPYPSGNQKIGDCFIRENKFCLLQIPSAVTKGDYNMLINPNHKDFVKVKITATEKFPFDKRIFR